MVRQENMPRSSTAGARTRQVGTEAQVMKVQAFWKETTQHSPRYSECVLANNPAPCCGCYLCYPVSSLLDNTKGVPL